MINAIIVEDEPKARNLLKKYLLKYCPQINVIGLAADAQEASDLIQKHQPQLLFLDIEISNETSPETSFDLLTQLPNYNYEVIFVTAFNDYALRAIQCHALAYLLKPINIEELENAVKYAERRIQETTENLPLQSLIQQLKLPGTTPARIWVPTGDGLEAFIIEEIIRLEAEGRYTLIHTKNKRQFLSTQNLKEFVNMLQQYSHFFLLHRSYFVNIKHVVKYVSTEGGFVKMSDGATIPIARRRKQAFLDLIEQQ